jgi:hypothetical protein
MKATITTHIERDDDTIEIIASGTFSPSLPETNEEVAEPSELNDLRVVKSGTDESIQLTEAEADRLTDLLIAAHESDAASDAVDRRVDEEMQREDGAT